MCNLIRFLTLSLFVLSRTVIAAPMSPTVPLPVPEKGIVSPQSMLAVSTNPLRTDTAYDITCLIDNHSGANVIMRFGHTTGYDIGSWGRFSLNNQELYNDQGQLVDQKSDNTVRVRINWGSENGAMRFTNLDYDASVRVHDCTAVPAVGSNKG